MKREYLTPEILVTYVDSDIITLSDTEIWWGDVIPTTEKN